MSSGQTSVMLVDDHPIVLQGLRALIDSTLDLRVSAVASTAREAIDAITTSVPDVALVDIALIGGNGIQLIQDISQAFPTVRSIALSMYDETIYARRVLQAGGRGYLMKEQASKLVLTAIRRVAAGHIYVSNEMAGRAINQAILPHARGAPIGPELTARETEILNLMGEALGTREIAERLFLSSKTVEAHREKIKEKLQLKNALELTQFALKRGIDSDRNRFS